MGEWIHVNDFFPGLKVRPTLFECANGRLILHEEGPYPQIPGNYRFVTKDGINTTTYIIRWMHIPE